MFERAFSGFRAVVALALTTALAAAQTVDVVGGTNNATSGAARAKGNSYEVTSAVTLTQAEFYLDFASSTTLRFTVHSSPVEFGSYTELHQSSAVVTGTGPGWYSSGPLNLQLAAGMHYIVAVSWSGTVGYYYGTGPSQVVSFGSHTHGYATGLHPLPTVFSSTSNDNAIYHQRLTTSSGPLPPAVYCTAGTTSSGCNAQIGASANPSVSAASPCQLQVSGVEGQKTGIVFYALAAQPLPWCTSGSSSFLCVKPPTMRTGSQSSGGTVGACDGALNLDWNAFQAANPGALGAPWSVGAKVFVQGWFRDPPACKTTSLSNAVELTYVP